jgi:hypothetical protein
VLAEYKPELEPEKKPEKKPEPEQTQKLKQRFRLAAVVVAVETKQRQETGPS